MVLSGNCMPVAHFKYSADREMESPLDVLSRAASLIQQEEARSKIEAEKDGSSDSGFEDNPSPPSKNGHHTERKDAVAKDGSLSSSPSTTSIKREEESSTEQNRTRSPVYMAMKEHAKLIQGINSENDTPAKETTYHFRHQHTDNSQEAPDVRNEQVERQITRSTSPPENETRESVIKTPVTPPSFNRYSVSPLTAAGHFGYPLLPHYASQLPMMSRPSVITAAGCPSIFKGPNFPCCHCMQSSCCPEMKHVYPERHGHSQELHSIITSGFDSPTVDDHFKKSLGPAYERLSPGGHRYEVEPTNSQTHQQSVRKEPHSPVLPNSHSHHKDMVDRSKTELYHHMQASPDRIFRDYSVGPTHKRHHYRFDPIGRYSPEHLHRYVPGMQPFEGHGLSQEHRFIPRSLEEPVTVDDHFAKALGKVWFDVQVRNSEHVMRYHNKGLRVAHQ